MTNAKLKCRLDRCSINTATLGHRSPIGKVVDHVASHGFGWIAPWRRDLEGVDLRQLRRQIDDAGLGVSSLCRSTYFPADDSSGAARAVAHLAAAESVNPEMLRYLNRLSDHLFVLSRALNGNGAGDVLWVPGQNR